MTGIPDQLPTSAFYVLYALGGVGAFLVHHAMLVGEGKGVLTHLPQTLAFAAIWPFVVLFTACAYIRGEFPAGGVDAPL